MGILGAVGDSVQGAVGLIEHAVIQFSEIPEGLPELVETSPLSLNVAGRYLDTRNSVFDLAKSALGTVADNAGDIGEFMKNTRLAKSTLGSFEQNSFVVQFNPTQVQISAMSGGMRMVNTYNNGQKHADGSGGMPKRIDYRFRLIIDNTNNYDAFSADKLITNMVNAGVKTTAAIARNMLGKGYSVRTQVEAFHAAEKLTDSMVTLTWGKQIISGQMTNVNSKYTMFNPNGMPIRAEVDITISSWNDEYLDNSFVYKLIEAGAKSNDAITSKKFGQSVSGILNI